MPQGATVPTALLRSLVIQRRVIGALLMREVITRFGRHNLGVLWLMGEPMLFTMGVVALWTLAGLAHGAGIPIVAFGITGYSSVLVWRNTVLRANSAVHQNIGLLYHRNVRVIDVLATRILLEIAGATASFTVLSLFFIAIEVIAPPVDMLQVMFGWLMLSWLGAALALTIGALTVFSTLVERLWHPISYLFFPISGAAFMVEWLTPSLQKTVLLLPMVHGVEMVREGYFGNTVRTHYDLSYMALWCLILTLSGFFLTRSAGLRVEAE